MSNQFESAVVKAESDHVVACEDSIFDEARGESLHRNGVAGEQLGRDRLEQGLPAAEVDEPLGEPYCIGRRSRHDGDSKKRMGKAESAVAGAKLMTESATVVLLKPKAAHRAKCDSAKTVLVKETVIITAPSGRSFAG